MDEAKPGPEFVWTASAFEADRLGLGEEQIIFNEGHVSALTHWMEDGTQQVSLFVNDIEVQGFNPASQQFTYKITGVRKYAQAWNTGGAYLDPSTIPPNRERVS